MDTLHFGAYSLGAVYLVVNYPSHFAVVAFLCVIFGLYVDGYTFYQRNGSENDE